MVWRVTNGCIAYHVLSVEQLSEDVEHYFRSLGLFFNSNISYSAYQQMVNEMTDTYHRDREPSLKSKMNTVLRSSGFAKGGVRGVWCEGCKTYRFHNFVYCPFCPNSEVPTKLLKGCQVKSCLACSANTEMDNKSGKEARQVSFGRVCHNSARNSEYEVNTLLPVDFLCCLRRFGLINRIKCSKRCTLWLYLEYAKENKKFFPLNCLNYGFGLSGLGEEECVKVIADTHKDVPLPEEVRSFANKAIAKCNKKTSIERSLLDISSCCFHCVTPRRNSDSQYDWLV